MRDKSRSAIIPITYNSVELCAYTQREREAAAAAAYLHWVSVCIYTSLHTLRRKSLPWNQFMRPTFGGKGMGEVSKIPIHIHQSAKVVNYSNI